MIIRKEIKDQDKINKVFKSQYLDNIVGYEDIKNIIINKVILPRKYKKLSAVYGKWNNDGILLYGLPGVGKTYITHEIAKELNYKYVTITVADLYCGMYSKNNFWGKLKKLKNAVVVFDNIDAITEIKTFQRDFYKKLTYDFKSRIQELLENKKILVMATTIKPWYIDYGMLSVGKFGEHIFVDLPNKEARFNIIINYLNPMLLEEKVDISDIVDRTEGYSCMDIINLCDEIKIKAMTKSLNEGKLSQVEEIDINVSLYLCKTTVNLEEKEAMKNFSNKIIKEVDC